MSLLEVSILGQRYTIKGDAPEEHIRQLSDFLNERLRRVSENTPNITPVKALILAAIDIADELHRLREDQEKFTKNIEEKTSLLSRLFD
jgi:cell division protein ZapA